MKRYLVRREGVGASAGIIQLRRLLMARVRIDHPTVIVVKRGVKILRGAADEFCVPDGSALVTPAGQTFDMINTPDEGTDGYQAEWLSFDPSVLKEFAPQETGRAALRPQVLTAPPSTFLAALQHAKAGVREKDSVPMRAAVARMVEILEWLRDSGIHLQPRAPSVADRTRHRLSADPAASWTAPALAEMLGMSEANLRRRLAGEGTSFNEILTDVRMSLALTLLQATDMSVKTIAFEAGYRCPSRFAARFRQRFGCAPRAIRTRER